MPVPTGAIDSHPAKSIALGGWYGRWAWALSLLFLAVGSFGLGLFNGALGDDQLLLSQRLAGVDGFAGLWGLFTQSYWGPLHTGGLYRPVMLWLLGAQRLCFGTDPVGFHAVSLLLHAGVSVLCFGLLRRFLPKPAAFMGAAVFACHPIHAEAVITVYGQADLWAALFMLVSLDRYAAWLHKPLSPTQRLVIYGAYLLSLGCKESAVLGPTAMVLIRGLYVSPDARGWRRWVSGREAGFAVPLAIYLVARFAVLGTRAAPVGEGSVAWGYPLWARANLVIVTIGTYLRLLVLPWGQTIYYGHLRDAIFGQPWAQLLWLLGGVAGLLGLGRWLDRRVVAQGNGWLVWGLLPVANLLPIGVVVAERCLYLPSIGVAFLVGGAFDRARSGTKNSLWVMAAIALVLAASVGLSARTCWRWRTPVSHWRATAADHPRSPKAHATLGIALLDEMVQGGEVLYPSNPRWVEAQRAMERAIELNPQSPDAWKGKGLLAMSRGEYREAIPYFERAYSLRPSDQNTYNYLLRCREAVEH